MAKRGYYTEEQFGALFVFDRYTFTRRRVYTNQEADNLGKPREYVIDARNDYDLNINPSADPTLVEGSNVYIMGSTFNRITIAHPKLKGTLTQRVRCCNIHGAIVVTHMPERTNVSSGMSIALCRHVDFDGFGDETLICLWKDRTFDPAKWGWQCISKWDSNHLQFQMHIKGKGTSYLHIEGFYFDRAPFASIQCKEDDKRDIDGYVFYKMKFRYNCFHRADSEGIYMGQVMRTTPSDRDGDGVYTTAGDGVWMPQVEPEFSNNLLLFIGTESIQMQRMIGSWKIKNNVVIGGGCNWLHAFQLSQHNMSQINLYSGGPATDPAEIAYNIFFGGSDRHLYYNVFEDKLFPKATVSDPDYFAATGGSGTFYEGGEVRIHHNVFYGTRHYHFWFKMLAGTTVTYLENNWFKGFRNDIDVLYGGSKPSNIWCYGSNATHAARMRTSGNKIHYDNPTGNLDTSNTQLKKYTSDGTDDINAIVEDPVFIAGGMIAADWHKYHMMNNFVTVSQAEGKKDDRKGIPRHLITPGVPIHGSEVSIKTSHAGGEGKPHIFQVGEIAIVRDGPVFKRLNTAGHETPITYTGTFDQGDGTDYLHPEKNKVYKLLDGTKITSTLAADTVNWEPATLPVQGKLQPGSFYDQQGLGLRPSPYEIHLGGTPPPAVLGCTDPNATNYDPNATEDDGSCTYPTASIPTKKILKNKRGMGRFF